MTFLVLSDAEWDTLRRLTNFRVEQELQAQSSLVTQLRADVARLTEENARLRQRVDFHTSPATVYVARSHWHDLRRALGVTRDDADIEAEQLVAERDALRQGMAQFREWLVDFIGHATPQPPGGQHVAPQKYVTTPSTLRDLKKGLTLLDTLLPPSEATT